MLEQAIRWTLYGLARANEAGRKPAPLSRLVLGVKCGGSDGFSGISANPAIGRAADLLAALGGSVVLGEFPELSGVENSLINRCVSREAAEKFIRLQEAFLAHACYIGSGFEANPSPDNLKDGLVTGAMKSAGAVRKGGTSPVVDVLDYAEPVTRPGLSLLCTPGNDSESVTALVGSGTTVVLFSTGLGTPVGNPMAPVVKVSTHSSAREFFGDPRLDIVSICTPPGERLEPALQAFEAGKHVLIEKPLEATLEGCDAIIEAAGRRGGAGWRHLPVRFHDSVQVLKKAIDAGHFGRPVLGGACVKWHRSQEYYDRGGWKSLKRFETGALMNQAIHAVDLLQWFMGPVESVQAFTATLGHEHLEVEDVAAATLRFAGGGRGIIEASTAVFPGFRKRIGICGTRGSAILEEEDLTFWQFDPPRPEDEEIRRAYGRRTRSGGGVADPAAIGVHGHRRQFEEFADALRENHPPAVDAAEARRAVAVILAIYRSARTGKAVRLEEG